MKYTLIAILFLLGCSKNEIEQVRDVLTPIDEQTIDVTQMGANGSDGLDDWAALQASIDSAVKISGKVFIPSGTYNISQPLMVYNWSASSNAYAQATCEIIGEDLMWSRGNGITRIIYNSKQGFALGVQQGKGVVVRGLFFDGKYTAPNITLDSMYRLKIDEYRDTTIPWDRYAPYAAVVVDPFSGLVPVTGGYETLPTWYRGPQTRSGSTGCRFEDITTRNFDVGFVTSPNGFTQNAEILTFENIRISNCRIGFAGSQAQEKTNRIINVGCWGNTHTLFTWTLTGQGHPGMWSVEGVNVAGAVANLVYRPSGSWFPLYMSNVFAESLGSIGLWQSGSGDAMINSSINFVYPSQVNAYHFAFAPTEGVTFQNCNIRIYGQLTVPMTFFDPLKSIRFDNGQQYVPPVHGRLPALVDSVDMGAYTLHRGGFSPVYYREGTNIKARINMKRYNMIPGDIAIMVSSGNWNITGMCRVASVDSTGFDVDYISGLHNQAIPTTFYIYRKK